MRLMRHGSHLPSTLRHVATRPVFPALASQSSRYRYASTKSYPERIAVLGGGVAGLSSAYFVSREFPNSKVTIFEAGKETGGWIKSKRVAVDGGDVIFELGPRTLRNATVTAHLVRQSYTMIITLAKMLWLTGSFTVSRARPCQGHDIHLPQ